jgi:2-oxoglutarate ferredoxin oxidoreductase subunit alpha
MPTATPISRVNDFVVRFANVNGSGSASANEMFARAVMRMGVPVAPRNIFPSNIQGLPTWYEVRISEAGHLGARGGTDLMVAMNPQTFDRDIAGIEPGGYLFYDSTKPLPSSKSVMTSRSSVCRSLRSAIANIPIRDNANCSRTSSISECSPPFSTWM